jgi:hypothetical protein
MMANHAQHYITLTLATPMLVLSLLTVKSPSGVIGTRALTHAAVVIPLEPVLLLYMRNMEANSALNFMSASIATQNLALLLSIASVVNGQPGVSAQ